MLINFACDISGSNIWMSKASFIGGYKPSIQNLPIGIAPGLIDRYSFPDSVVKLVGFVDDGHMNVLSGKLF